MPTLTVTIDDATAAYLTAHLAKPGSQRKGLGTLAQAAADRLAYAAGREAALAADRAKDAALRAEGVASGVTRLRYAPRHAAEAVADPGQREREAALVRHAAHCPGHVPSAPVRRRAVR